MTSSALRIAESDLQSCIVDACHALQLPVFHIRDSRRNMGEGFPDLVIADHRAGIVRFWELKSDKGRLRPKQADWLVTLAQCRQVEVALIRPDSLDSVLELLGGAAI